jgi:putative membrane protein
MFVVRAPSARPPRPRSQHVVIADGRNRWAWVKTADNSGLPPQDKEARGGRGLAKWAVGWSAVFEITRVMNTAPALDTGTRLAADRTWLAHERTLMAWVRTATSLITFGFTIYKFFQLESGRSLPEATGGVLSPRAFAMIMIGTGLVALFLSTIEHRQSMRLLRAEFGTARQSVAGVVAAVVSVMGLLAFFAAMLRG